jgi:hypothetical protein
LARSEACCCCTAAQRCATPARQHHSARVPDGMQGILCTAPAPAQATSNRLRKQSTVLALTGRRL